MLFSMLFADAINASVFRVFMGCTTSSLDANVESVVNVLDKEALRENDLSMSDILSVSRATLNSSSSDLESYGNKVTLSHLEVSCALCVVVM